MAEKHTEWANDSIGIEIWHGAYSYTNLGNNDEQERHYVKLARRKAKRARVKAERRQRRDMTSTTRSKGRAHVSTALS